LICRLTNEFSQLHVGQTKFSVRFFGVDSTLSNVLNLYLCNRDPDCTVSLTAVHSIPQHNKINKFEKTEITSSRNDL